MNVELNVHLYGVAQGATITLNKIQKLNLTGEHEQATELLRVLEYTKVFELLKLYDGTLPVNDSHLLWRYNEELSIAQKAQPKPVLKPSTAFLSDKLEKAAFLLTELLAEINTQVKTQNTIQ